ncbi:hypothetical protein LJR231_002247 [Phyllobacterium sp. LjRoot231]|uniref:hypothetical protein n=1 Tax=Phyllobacterium sp. LjRoot231 TaxID=3342289 RepID=UPI003ECEE004
MIALSDTFGRSSPFKDLKQLMESLVGAMNLAFIQQGFGGGALVEARLIDGHEPGSRVATIACVASHEQLTVKLVSAYLKEQKRKAE